MLYRNLNKYIAEVSVALFLREISSFDIFNYNFVELKHFLFYGDNVASPRLKDKAIIKRIAGTSFK